MSLMNQTAGGKQFWADVWFFHDWRIQCHALTGHYRLLDGSNRRHASGTYEECRDKMDEIRTRDKIAADGGQGNRRAARIVSNAVEHGDARRCVVEVWRVQDILRRLSDDARQRGVARPIARQRGPQYYKTERVVRTTLSSERACDSTLPRVVG